MRRVLIPVIWIIILILSLDIFVVFSCFKLNLFEKALVLLFDLIFFSFAFLFLNKQKVQFFRILFVISIIPVLYLGFRFNIHILREPTFWIVFLKSFLLNAILLYIERKRGEVDFLSKLDNVINWGAPIFLIIGFNLFYVFFDLSPLSWDPARHGHNAIIVKDILLGRGEGIIDSWMHYDTYPPLGYLATIPFQLIFGTSNESLILSLILLWFPITYILTQKIFREAFNIRDGRETFLNFALHSNVLLLSFMKQFMLDYQMFTFLVLQFYFLFRSDAFKETKYCFFAGLSLGGGFMIKQSSMVFGALLFGAYLFFLVRNDFLRSKPSSFLRYYINLSVFAVGVAILVIPWFSGWSYMFYWEMKGLDKSSGMIEGDPNPYTIESLLWYFKAFVYYFTWPGLLIILFGYGVAWIKSDQKKLVFLLFTALTATWVFFTSQWNKDVRFITPIFLFFIPGFVGLIYLEKKISAVLIGLLLLVSLYINFAQVFPDLGNHKLLGDVSPYAKTYADGKNINTPLTVAVACKLLQENGVDYFSLENNYEHSDYNVHNRNFYFRMLGINPNLSSSSAQDTKHKEVFSWENNRMFVEHEQRDSGYHYVLFRDSAYPSYYLYSLAVKGTSLDITLLGKYGRITGDIRFIITQSTVGAFRSDTISVNRSTTVPISDAGSVSINAQILHTHGRWPLIFRQQFTGEIDIKENLSLKPYDMIPLRSEVKDKAFILRK